MLLIRSKTVLLLKLLFSAEYRVKNKNFRLRTPDKKCNRFTQSFQQQQLDKDLQYKCINCPQIKQPLSSGIRKFDAISF
jgi:hypothetical protein